MPIALETLDIILSRVQSEIEKKLNIVVMQKNLYLY